MYREVTIQPLLHITSNLTVPEIFVPSVCIHSLSSLKTADLISREFLGPSDDVDIGLIFVYSGKINLKQIHK